MRLFRKISFILALLVIAALVPLTAAARRMDVQTENSKNRLLSGSFTALRGDSSHDIKPFFDGEACYLFLPQYTESLRFSFNAHHALIDGKEYRSGDALELQPLEGKHRFGFVNDNGEEFEKESIEIILSGDIPSVFIDSGSGRYLENGKKTYKEYCGIEIVNPDGTAEYRSLNRWSDKIRGRGNTSWRGSSAADPMAKNAYNLYLDRSADLFGMGASKEWVMLANLFDKSNIRNKFVYDLAARIGLEYSPESVFADVYIDNEYRGVYQLSEKIQVGKERVDIGSQGILFSMEAKNRLTGKPEEVTTAHGQALMRVFPTVNYEKSEDVFSARVEAFENVLFSDFTLEEIGEYIDIDSWAKIGLLEEFFADYDAWKTSQYFYIKPEDGKIYAGPIWDFDNSSGNCMANIHPQKSAVENILIFRSKIDGVGDDTLWFYRLMQNADFYDYVCDIYSRSIYPYLKENTDEIVEEYYRCLGSSHRMNCVRWDFEMNDADVFKAFVRKRLEFLKRIWIDKEPYCLVTYETTGMSMGYFENEVCPADVYFYTWFFDKERTEPTDPFVPEHDTVLYAEVEQPIPR